MFSVSQSAQSMKEKSRRIMGNVRLHLANNFYVIHFDVSVQTIEEKWITNKENRIVMYVYGTYNKSWRWPLAPGWRLTGTGQCPWLRFRRKCLKNSKLEFHRRPLVARFETVATWMSAVLAQYRLSKIQIIASTCRLGITSCSTLMDLWLTCV